MQTGALYHQLIEVGVKFDHSEEKLRELIPDLFTMQLSTPVNAPNMIIPGGSPELPNQKKERIPVTQRSDVGLLRPVTFTIQGMGQVAIDKIPPNYLDKMMLNPIAAFAYAIKIAPLIQRWRDTKTWMYRGSDPKLVEKARWGMYRFLYHSIAAFATGFIYGASYNEVIWKYYTAEQIGCDPAIVPPDELVACPEPVISINPHAVSSIQYEYPKDKSPRKFDGFMMTRTDGVAVHIERGRALVITNNKRFGRVEGQTGLLPAIPYIHMYDMVVRAAMQFYDRMGVPLAIVYFPEGEMVFDEELQEEIPAQAYALKLAEQSTRYTAIAIPSSTGIFQGNDKTPKWRIEFPFQANNQSAGAVFDQAIQQLEKMIMRGIVVADRVGTQDEQYGSYGLGEVHKEVTDVHTQTLMYDMMSQLENYLFPLFVDFNDGGEGSYLSLDMPKITEDISQITNVFGNIVQIHPDMAKIDLEAMGTQLRIPFKSADKFAEETLAQADLDAKVTQITTPPEMLQPAQPSGGSGKPVPKKASDTKPKPKPKKEQAKPKVSPV